MANKWYKDLLENKIKLVEEKNENHEYELKGLL